MGWRVHSARNGREFQDGELRRKIDFWKERHWRQFYLWEVWDGRLRGSSTFGMLEMEGLGRPLGFPVMVSAQPLAELALLASVATQAWVELECWAMRGVLALGGLGSLDAVETPPLEYPVDGELLGSC